MKKQDVISRIQDLKMNCTLNELIRLEVSLTNLVVNRAYSVLALEDRFDLTVIWLPERISNIHFLRDFRRMRYLILNAIYNLNEHQGRIEPLLDLLEREFYPFIFEREMNQKYQYNFEYFKDEITKFINEKISEWDKQLKETKQKNTRNLFIKLSSNDEFRKRIWEKTKGRCLYCGADLDGLDSFHIDHYKPVCKGGTNKASNLVPACPSFNVIKNGRTIEEFRNSTKRKFYYENLDSNKIFKKAS